jgi:hypothetical protein
MQKISHLAERIGNVYLYYLALMPALGTFTLFFVLKTHVNPMLFFLLGTAAIGVFLAFTGSYTVITQNPVKNLLMIIDGPIWMALSLFFGGSWAVVIVNEVLTEIAGVLLSVLFVIFTSTVPTSKERRAAFIAVGLPFAGLLLLFFTYAQEQQLAWQQGVAIAAAALQGALVQYKLGITMNVQRPSENIILIGILSWMFALFFLWPILEFVLHV